MEKKCRIDLEVPDDINSRRKKLGHTWREVIYAGLNILEKAPIEKLSPEEEYKTLLKRLYELFQKR